MPTELKMPALSPTMEEGTLAKWLVKEGDEVKSGDILAEIETDKATMEFEAVDEGTIAKILVAEGTDGVKVGAPIAILAGEGEDVSAAAPKADTAPAEPPKAAAAPEPKPDATPKAPLPRRRRVETPAAPAQPAAPPRAEGDRVKASPLARRLAEAQGVDLNALQGSGPDGRIVRADVDSAVGKAPAAAPAGARQRHPRSPAARRAPGPMELAIPHEAIKLSNMRKTIARRLTESKQQVPHIYLTRRHPARRAAEASRRAQRGLESARGEARRSTTC